jgi:hypothetical protein
MADMQQKTVPNVGRFGCLGKKLRVKRRLTRWLVVTIRFETPKISSLRRFGTSGVAGKLNMRENAPLALLCSTGVSLDLGQIRVRTVL